MGDQLAALPSTHRRLEQHVIVCGFGGLALQLVRLCSKHKTPTLLLAPESARGDSRLNEIASITARVQYGDFAQLPVLKRASIERAKAVALVADDDTSNLVAARVIEAANLPVVIVARCSNLEVGLRVQDSLPHTVVLDLAEVGARRFVQEALELLGHPGSGTQWDAHRDPTETAFTVFDHKLIVTRGSRRRARARSSRSVRLSGDLVADPLGAELWLSDLGDTSRWNARPAWSRSRWLWWFARSMASRALAGFLSLFTSWTLIAFVVAIELIGAGVAFAYSRLRETEFSSAFPFVPLLIGALTTLVIYAATTGGIDRRLDRFRPSGTFAIAAWSCLAMRSRFRITVALGILSALAATTAIAWRLQASPTSEATYVPCAVEVAIGLGILSSWRRCEGYAREHARRAQHFIVVGLGNTGTRVVRLLLDANASVFATDSSPSCPSYREMRRLGVPTLRAYGGVAEVLRVGRAARAACVLAVTECDLANLEVALRTATLSRPKSLRRLGATVVVARVYREGLGKLLTPRERAVVSAVTISETTAPAVYQALMDGARTFWEQKEADAALHRKENELVVAEVRVQDGSQLSRMGAAGIQRRFGVTVVLLQREAGTTPVWWPVDADDLGVVGRSTIVIAGIRKALIGCRLASRPSLD